jgi:hypothetical protein
MTAARHGAELRDRRMFGLFDLRHGHSFVLLRGFPADDEFGEPVQFGMVLDGFFAGVRRIACWKDFSPLHLREATPEHADEVVRRIGPMPFGGRLFLLEEDSLESYVIAHAVEWAEFLIGGGAPSPLVSEDEDYRAAHPAQGEQGRLLRPERP